MAGGEVQDRLAAGGFDDLADVAHHERAPRHRPEQHRLQVAEERVVARDLQNGLARGDVITFEERVHLELPPARLPAGRPLVPRAEPEDRERLVDAAEHRVAFLEDLQHDDRVTALGLQQRLGRVEVGV